MTMQILAAVFLGMAAVVSFVRYGKSRNNGQWFIGVCFLLASVIFGYLGMGGLK